MLATTWVQIIKAGAADDRRHGADACWCWRGSAGTRSSCSTRPRPSRRRGETFLQPGLASTNPVDTVSLGLGLVLGTAGLPHILMRFFTVPDAKAARTSVVWAVAPDRRLLPDDHRAGLRRAGDPGRRPARRPRARAATWPRRSWPRSWAAARAPPAATCSWRHRRGGVRDHPGRGGRAGDLGLGRGGPRRLVEHRAQGPRLREARRSTWPGSPRSRSARSRS